MVNCKRKQVFNEANKYVDALAKWGCQQVEDFATFHLPPSDSILIDSLLFLHIFLKNERIYSNRLTIVSAYVLKNE